ncbi:hypothetical protein ALMP_17710 [Streptomyces sp. A012304]|nr:hypothetical protein ALMP_17710 [Streptomyces sp. A012304]
MPAASRSPAGFPPLSPTRTAPRTARPWLSPAAPPTCGERPDGYYSAVEFAVRRGLTREGRA